jgi:hypothetical protein
MKEADSLLDQIKFFNEVSIGIRYTAFLKERQLSRLFVPTATFHDDEFDLNDEFISMMEGVQHPYFGIAFSIDKV